MAQKTKIETPSIEFNKVRGMIREELNKRYGGVTKFLTSDKGNRMGGMKIKIYLYDTGPVNFEVIRELCKFLGIGEFTRKIAVVRSVSYHLTNNPKTK